MAFFKRHSLLFRLVALFYISSSSIACLIEEEFVRQSYLIVSVADENDEYTQRRVEITVDGVFYVSRGQTLDSMPEYFTAIPASMESRIKVSVNKLLASDETEQDQCGIYTIDYVLEDRLERVRSCSDDAQDIKDTIDELHALANP